MRLDLTLGSLDENFPDFELRLSQREGHSPPLTARYLNPTMGRQVRGAHTSRPLRCVRLAESNITDSKFGTKAGSLVVM